MQRINMQCDVFPPVRLLIEAMMHTIPLLDFLVVREYPSRSRVQPGPLMPATLHAVVVK